MTNRPSLTMDPVVLFNDAGDGASYGAYPDPGIGWRGQRLSDVARSDLQSSLSFDWFAIGYTGVGNLTDWSVSYNGFQTDSAPRLIVYYTLGRPPVPDVGCRQTHRPVRRRRLRHDGHPGLLGLQLRHGHRRLHGPYAGCRRV